MTSILGMVCAVVFFIMTSILGMVCAIVFFIISAFHLGTSVYLSRTLIPLCAHDFAYHLHFFHT